MNEIESERVNVFEAPSPSPAVSVLLGPRPIAASGCSYGAWQGAVRGSSAGLPWRSKEAMAATTVSIIFTWLVTSRPAGWMRLWSVVSVAAAATMDCRFSMRVSLRLPWAW